MGIPKLMLGKRDEAVLVEVGEGYTDDGAGYDLLARTARIAVAGVSGEAIFTTLHLAVIHGGATTLYVTPIVDGVRGETQTIALAALAVGEEEAAGVYELGLTQPFEVGGVEVMRTALRGCWFQLEVATDVAASGVPLARVVLEGAEVEYEIVRETQVPA